MVHYFIVLMVVGLVFLEPDLGTALIIFAVGFSMFYMGGVSWRQLGKMGLCLLPIVIMGISVFGYQKQRLVDYIHSITGTGPMSYQIKQSIIGLAQGGLAGTGVGGGKQKMLFLPEPFSDFILSSLGEELGFLGLCLVFIMLGLILWRGIRIAQNAPDKYGYLLAGGITVLIMVNALMNAGVVVNLLPTTGLPFPFLSYGGSSLIVQLMGVGILLNISKKKAMSYKRYSEKRAKNGRLYAGAH
jgi:cell division protein FtsW